MSLPSFSQKDVRVCSDHFIDLTIIVAFLYGAVQMEADLKNGQVDILHLMMPLLPAVALVILKFVIHLHNLLDGYDFVSYLGFMMLLLGLTMFAGALFDPNASRQNILVALATSLIGFGTGVGFTKKYS